MPRINKKVILIFFYGTQLRRGPQIKLKIINILFSNKNNFTIVQTIFNFIIYATHEINLSRTSKYDMSFLNISLAVS